MKADKTKTYAQIVDGKCHWVFTWKELPEWNNEQVPAVDVTGNIPNEGDLYVNGVFIQAPKPEKAPIRVSPWQIRKALNQLNLRQAVEATVAFSNDQTIKDGWEFATSFVRTDPFVVLLGSQLGKTEAELDALFELAATL